jgi:hypothetical protein
MADYDIQIAERFLTAIRGGSTLDTALDYAGLSKAAFEGWLEAAIAESDRVERGEAPRAVLKPLMAFWDAYKKARVEPIVRNVARVQQAAQDGSWQAAAWWLERAVPELYGRPVVKSRENFTPIEKDAGDDTPAMD